MEESASDLTPKLNPFTTVTPLSKALALILFVALPFLGFYLGMKYQNPASPSQPYTSNPTTTISQPQPSFSNLKNQATPSAIAIPSGWKTYIGNNRKFVFSYPSDWTFDPLYYEFSDKNNNVTATITDGNLTTEKNLTCDDFNKILDAGGKVKTQELGETSLSVIPPTIIGQIKKIINGQEWSVRVTKVIVSSSAQGGVIWYPNEYCLKKPDENRLFLIKFHEPSPVAKNSNLYEQILSTFKFLP